MEKHQREIKRLQLLNKTLMKAINDPNGILVFKDNPEGDLYFYPHYKILSIGDMVSTNTIKQGIIQSIDKNNSTCNILKDNTTITILISDISYYS